MCGALADTDELRFGQNGISEAIRANCTSEKLMAIAGSDELHGAASTMLRVFSDGPWTAELRDDIVAGLPNSLFPEGYFKLHLVRSLAVAFGKPPIACGDDWFEMSAHNRGAIGVLRGMSPAEFHKALINGGAEAPDCDMQIELILCQTKTVFDYQQRDDAEYYDLESLAAFDALRLIYAREHPTESVADNANGISLASKGAYVKIKGLRVEDKPRTLLTRPAFNRAYFVELAVALLKSRVIAKSPLANASDIRALIYARRKLEATRFDPVDVMKAMIVAHRTWSYKRIRQFIATLVPPMERID